jgi:dTDP-4-amino-4,6-dideoxygalactose transaminase
VLKSGWLTTGPEALAFEAEFAEFLSPQGGNGLKALCVNSATSGLHLALEASGVVPGDLVAVPTLTFTATAEIVRYLGADPVFIDSQESSGNMDPQLLKAAFNSAAAEGKTLRAVIPVHLAGHPCDMAAIKDAATGTGAVVVEDAAHGFPSSTPAGMAGTLGDIGVFSFYATKTITTGEGGMVVTRNAAYGERMRLMRLHGIDRVIWNRYSTGAGARSWEYDVTAPGFKYNMTDVAAAIGRVQLTRAYDFLESRRALAAAYTTELGGIPGLSLPEDAPGHAWHLYIIHTRNTEIRNLLAQNLQNEGIGTSVHFIPLHRMSYWKNHYNLNMEDFPVADSLSSRSLSLPLWPGLKRKDLLRISAIIRKTAGG